MSTAARGGKAIPFLLYIKFLQCQLSLPTKVNESHGPLHGPFQRGHFSPWWACPSPAHELGVVSSHLLVSKKFLRLCLV